MAPQSKLSHLNSDVNLEVRKLWKQEICEQPSRQVPRLERCHPASDWSLVQIWMQQRGPRMRWEGVARGIAQTPPPLPWLHTLPSFLLPYCTTVYFSSRDVQFSNSNRIPVICGHQFLAWSTYHLETLFTINWWWKPMSITYPRSIFLVVYSSFSLAVWPYQSANSDNKNKQKRKKEKGAACVPVKMFRREKPFVARCSLLDCLMSKISVASADTPCPRSIWNQARKHAA